MQAFCDYNMFCHNMLLNIESIVFLKSHENQIVISPVFSWSFFDARQLISRNFESMFLLWFSFELLDFL